MTEHTTNDSLVKLCECGCGQPAPIAKRNDTRAGQIKGQAIRFISGHQFKVRTILPPEERFWPKVDKRGPNECWPWLASNDQHGYGAFWTGEYLTKAHRFSYSLANGSIPDGIDILHRCDNPSCCNPDHLFAGTAKDNVDDMISKGRESKPPRNRVDGERNGHAQYTDAQVRQFRKEFAERKTSIAAFAEFKGVTYQIMRNLLRRHTYPNA